LQLLIDNRLIDLQPCYLLHNAAVVSTYKYGCFSNKGQPRIVYPDSPSAPIEQYYSTATGKRLGDPNFISSTTHNTSADHFTYNIGSIVTTNSTKNGLLLLFIIVATLESGLPAASQFISNRSIFPTTRR
jgi:hypothetical protein